MDTSNLGGVLMLISNIILGINLLVIILPIYKMVKKQIRCYQTPFLFVFAAMAEYLYNLGPTVFKKNSDNSDNPILEYIIIGVVLLFALAIIFGDQVLPFWGKCLILLGFLGLESPFFLASLITAEISTYFKYVFYFIFSIGPIECLIGCIVNKNYTILPILNLFLLLCYNIVFGITYNFYFITKDLVLFIMTIVGGVSCIIQIILYFVYRANRKNEDPLQTDKIVYQVMNLEEQPLVPVVK